ncbi:MAG: OB-fold domain-containing protein [Azospirillaceae bacterium]|nr:OB-fold domain-containing protein [Azospirillaceae bacterium]
MTATAAKATTAPAAETTFVPGYAPGVPFLKADAHGQPYIEGHRCGACGAAYTLPRLACPRCFSRDALVPFRSSGRGHVHTYTVVHRSYPGIKVPFVSAIVDLDDGLVLKGNLTGVPIDPTQIPFGLPIRVVFDEVPGQKDAQGLPYLTYFFAPEKDAAA